MHTNSKKHIHINPIKIKLTALALCVCVLLAGACYYLPGIVSVSTSVNGRDLPIYCVQTDKPQIALTFDAAWGNEDTRQILATLKKHNVHVTFFMTGGWVESYPDDVKAILADGHDLGNHSENHKNMSQLSTDQMREELTLVHEKVKNLTGYEMFLFRPPYGDYSRPHPRSATTASNGMSIRSTGRTTVSLQSLTPSRITSILATVRSFCATMVPNTPRRHSMNSSPLCRTKAMNLSECPT